MVFSSYVFLFLFLPILTVGYYLIPKRSPNLRNTFLLLFSFIFYGWGGVKYLLLLIISIGINWLFGFLIFCFRDEQLYTQRKISLGLAIVLNCLILGVFKYTDFLIGNLNLFLGTEIPLKHIILPVGISFYTFQGMSYVIDVYRDPRLCLKNPLAVALYISMFPQLVAGPIVRFADIAEEIGNRTENLENVVTGLQRFILGLGKKLILADTFGIMADHAFSSEYLSTGLAWIGALAYTLQIYFDFSGYSDMAVGLGRLFGFHFSENFNYPYISSSITEFWRRWHISLSSWFRDYIYIPLGGSRCSHARQILNMSVVWILTGIWHGASWNYVLWGIYYLIWLVAEKYLLSGITEHVPIGIRRFATLLVVIFGWVLFRANGLSHAITYVRAMLGIGGTEMGINEFIVNVLNYRAFWLAGFVGATPFLRNMVVNLSAQYEESLLFSVAKYICVFSIFLLCVIYIIASSHNAFIYFQF